MNSLTIANAQLQHQKERPAKRVVYDPVTGLTNQVPAMPLDSALSSSSTNPVQNRAISEAVIDLTNKASHNAAGIERNASDISLLNERTNSNAIAIQHNANAITELDTKTDALTATVANVSEDIETVNSNMAALDDKVNTFSDAIEQNTRDIQKNKRDIQQNANDIARVEEEISDVSEVLVTVREHTVEIAALDNKVNINTANIATNTTAISNEVTRATGAEGALQTAIGNIPIVSANTSDTPTETLSNLKVGNTVYGASTGSGVPVGSVIDYWGTTDPDDWFICDGRDTTGTDIELETNYPVLYAILGNSNKLPDLRECVTVGAGKNTTNIFDSTENPDPSDPSVFGTQAHDVYTVGEFKDDQLQDHTHVYTKYNNRKDVNWSSAAHIWVGESPANTSSPTGRIGTTTHGKQVGCNKIIKAK